MPAIIKLNFYIMRIMIINFYKIETEEINKLLKENKNNLIGLIILIFLKDISFIFNI